MKPPAFAYVRAESEDEILSTLRARGAEARILAGGQSLLPMLNMRLVKPAVLIDIMRVPPLWRIAAAGGQLTISAGARQSAVLLRPSLAQEAPMLAAALPWVGYFQTRARGTVCGSVAHADPSAEIPLCLVALGGQVHLRGPRNSRRVAAEDFFLGTMATKRADDEFVSAVSFPLRRAGTGYAFAELGRQHGDFAIVACAAVVDGSRMRLAVGGVADRPTVRDFPVLDGTALDDALNGLAWDLDAGDDVHATARFRRDLVRALGRKALEEARACRA
jgi:2-furoyl-CoA dehydrogenase FAD binding subunit